MEMGLPNVNHVSEEHSHGQAPEWCAFMYVNVYTCVYMCANTRSFKSTPVISYLKEVERGRGKLDSASLRKMGGICKASYRGGDYWTWLPPHIPMECGRVTRGLSDCCLPQSLCPAHSGQPGHRATWGDSLEPLPLPAAGLGHRVPLYPQRGEVLGQGEAWEAGGQNSGAGEEVGCWPRLRR